MKNILYITIYALFILWLTSCSVKDYDLNPATSVFRWVMTNEME
tara:strand:+ start:470 stop:601 length:132 start_codon:yes stop_codon:yes gene_type:complete